MHHPDELYPLIFEPIYKEKVWGGRSLEKLGRTLPGDAAVGIGESWEIADLATTSVSGGGGSAEHSVVANDSLAGQTLRQLVETFGERLLGKGVSPAEDGGFPLLIKFLDAKENLSVQVHPSTEYAAAHEDAHLKSEAWYIVDAEPGAVIYKGLAPGTTADMLRAAIQANTDEAVVPLLNAVPARKGDCHYLPSGTLHALGAGVLVAEVQTPSDTTFRVYDWGRTDRELHIEQAMACIDFSHRDAQPATVSPQGMPDSFTATKKARCKYFKIDEITVGQASAISSGGNDASEIWTVLEGGLSLRAGSFDNPLGERRDFKPGQTVLIPGQLGPMTYLYGGASRCLRINLP